MNLRDLFDEPIHVDSLTKKYKVGQEVQILDNTGTWVNATVCHYLGFNPRSIVAEMKDKNRRVVNRTQIRLKQE